MATLVKFCEPEYNILNRCHTIRFGTLEYYREMDPAFYSIADPDEGRESVLVNSIDTANSTTEAAAAVASIAPLPHIHVKDMKLKLTFPNCYIWCCSKVPKTFSAQLGAQFDIKYTSYYAITDVNRFAQRLSELLMSSIKSSEFIKDIVQEFSVGEMREISLNCFHRDVLYVDDKISTIDEGHLNPIPFN